jgi:hypothetical protein|mmetsp:Transcript_3719/g.8225  ORF Transcript_3719/g.8225 Transcript_3719/m.8225 type:complete len:112 (+) Transcript_3719:52-387(+)
MSKSLSSKYQYNPQQPPMPMTIVLIKYTHAKFTKPTVHRGPNAPLSGTFTIPGFFCFRTSSVMLKVGGDEIVALTEGETVGAIDTGASVGYPDIGDKVGESVSVQAPRMIL